ncbi:SURF1 family protein [Skermania sp. ID1734]|uniref:SURF1 family cytochrome oxidase biogenesis protein n=1 Tax=Skermania sp. ID1734 TaxID=2597516 RepID=UPI001181712F|nr:SURF1 family protein [Skermania sp. ID1734]TSE01081.1 SURF1 family protein [Skermania sp. ID1734]
MRRLKFLLRPGWLILALVVVAFAYLCFTVLAPWQLGKNTRTEHRNNLISQSVSAAPVPADQLVGPEHPKADDEWRRVNATGHYLNNSTVLVRLRTDRGNPAYEVLTPFRLTDGRTVLVDRGYVPTIESGRPAAIAPAPTGTVTLEARIRLSEGVVPGKAPIDQDGYKQVYSIDSGQISSLLGMPLASGYLQLDENQPGVLDPVGLPQLDAGPYLSYGLQWLAFGVMAPLGLAYFIRAELRERRKDKKGKKPKKQAVTEPAPFEVAEPVATPGAPEPAVPTSAADATVPKSVADATVPKSAADATAAKLADRYGKRR